MKYNGGSTNDPAGENVLRRLSKRKWWKNHGRPSYKLYKTSLQSGYNLFFILFFYWFIWREKYRINKERRYRSKRVHWERCEVEKERHTKKKQCSFGKTSLFPRFTAGYAFFISDNSSTVTSCVQCSHGVGVTFTNLSNNTALWYW